MRDPGDYIRAAHLGPIYGHIAETKRLVSEPILSHRLARVAISCIQYLFRCRANTQDYRLHWAMKSKQSPWLWGRWMRVTSTRRQPYVYFHGPTYSFPQSLRQSRQLLYSEVVQSEKFYLVQRRFYILTLNLLYFTLRKARKSDELTRALSKPFVPLSASLLFPRRIKRLRKAIDVYLEKVRGEPVQISKATVMHLYHVNSSVHHRWKHNKIIALLKVVDEG